MWLAILFLLATQPEDKGLLDLLIRGGSLVDGSGAPARPADVAIRGDTIVAVVVSETRPLRR